MRRTSLAPRLRKSARQVPLTTSAHSEYMRFRELDGSHPWAKAVPEACVLYKVRRLESGQIDYFNFALAKEMGLISPEHPEKLNSQLESILLDSFSIRVINEYDIENGISYPESSIKPGHYMATRYLQIQHPGKKGETSGDGRCIWNGVLRHRGKTWDVSSRGTGVTRLAPGFVEAGRPLKTGSTDFGYGCGLAEIDELYAEAISAESMHLQGHQTERVLCIINLGEGYGIGVRAGMNLLRPAHLLRLYRLEKWPELRRALRYHFSRQRENSRMLPAPEWPGAPFMRQFAQQMARFAAVLEADYIFMWLEWDGDNILLEPGIIDYGSIRQFGMCHNRYQYDDVERMSTTLSEQKDKAKHLVLDMYRMFSRLKGRRPKPAQIKKYALQFDRDFKAEKYPRRLYQFGLDPWTRERLLEDEALLKKFFRAFDFLENVKATPHFVRVPDGINRPALFNMRKLTVLMWQYYATHALHTLPNVEHCFAAILNQEYGSKSSKLFLKYRSSLKKVMAAYQELLKAVYAGQKSTGSSWPQTLQGILKRAEKTNSESRLTGNAIIQIVNHLVAARKRGLSPEGLQNIFHHLIHLNIDSPEVKTGPHFDRRPRIISHPKIYSKILRIIRSCSEEI